MTVPLSSMFDTAEGAFAPSDRARHRLRTSNPSGLWGWALFLGTQAARFYLAWLAALIAVAAIPSLLLPDWSSYLIQSDSMAPRLRQGDIVLAELRDDLSPGQVITFRNAALGGAITTHRMVSDLDGRLTTRGDANTSNDPMPTAPQDVLGTGRIKVPLIGLPMLWLRAGQWWCCVLFLASVVGAVIAACADPLRKKSARDPVPTSTGDQ